MHARYTGPHIPWKVGARTTIESLQESISRPQFIAPQLTRVSRDHVEQLVGQSILQFPLDLVEVRDAPVVHELHELLIEYTIM